MKTTMIQTIAAALAGAALMTAVTSATAETTEKLPRLTSGNTYAMTAVVVASDPIADVVTVKDFNGHEWAFTGVEDYLPGDVCSLVMYDRGTWIVYDDEIISARYDGWVEGWSDIWDGEKDTARVRASWAALDAYWED